MFYLVLQYITQYIISLKPKIRGWTNPKVSNDNDMLMHHKRQRKSKSHTKIKEDNRYQKITAKKEMATYAKFFQTLTPYAFRHTPHLSGFHLAVGRTNSFLNLKPIRGLQSLLTQQFP